MRINMTLTLNQFFNQCDQPDKCRENANEKEEKSIKLYTRIRFRLTTKHMFISGINFTVKSKWLTKWIWHKYLYFLCRWQSIELHWFRHNNFRMRRNKNVISSFALCLKSQTQFWMYSNGKNKNDLIVVFCCVCFLFLCKIVNGCVVCSHHSFIKHSTRVTI